MINLYSGTFTPLHKNVTIVKPMFITFKKRVYEEGKEFMIGFGHGKRPAYWGGGGGWGAPPARIFILKRRQHTCMSVYIVHCTVLQSATALQYVSILQ